jgi:mono/diheme cytochrome c family protein
MIRPSMSRPAKVLLIASAAIAVMVSATACGTERISVPTSNTALHQGATLFNQRCGGCHTLSFAATHGSASNPRTAEIMNGPNFDVRCERPITRVLYAIENGGFSGAIMPQNVVIGQDAIDVARFVATYAGRQAKTSPGVPSCQQQQVGTLPTASATATTGTPSTGSTSTTPAPSATTPAANGKKAKPKASKGNGKKAAHS